MFSRRTGWSRELNRIARRLDELRGEGRPLIDLTESNPTRVGLSPTAAELRAALQSAPDEALARYDPDPRGRRLPLALPLPLGTGGGVLLASSTSEAYAWLFKLLCDPGDDVLVPQPSYPLFEYLAGLEAVDTRTYPLHFDGEWHLEAADVAAASTERTRAVLVVNPGNPTGNYLKRAEHGALTRLCAERGWALISDEVFADYPLIDTAPDRLPHAASPDAPCLTVSLSGLSKTLALPQLKLGWMHVEGPPAFRDEALARLEVIADTYLPVNALAQAALPALLPLKEPVQRRIRARVRANRDQLIAARGPDAEWNVLPMEGGWSAILRIPSRVGEEDVCLRLLDEGVVVQPGYFFDFAAHCYLVVSLLPEPEVFAEGARRLARVLASL